LRPLAQPLIEAEDLARAYGRVRAVNGVSLQVGSGEIYALVGPDGAGKTTTLRLLCGALRPHRGRVRLAGFDVAEQSESARASLGYLPQRFSLYGDLTVAENLRFLAEVRGLPAKDWQSRSREILGFVGLLEFSHRRAELLSGGMRQKLGLAAALIHRPRVLILDEPTSGVDPVTRQDFWRLLLRTLSAGVAVLLSTPYMDEAQRCSRVGLMARGKILAEGPPRSLVKELQGRVVELRGSPRRALAEAAGLDPAVEAVQPFGDRIHLRVPRGQAEAVIARLPSLVADRGGRVDVVRGIEPSLEDAFLFHLESTTRPG
jgi:ABC-2 type transport system ATP-binding protein